jgi:Protein of unknown function (DUF3037)
MPHFKHCDFFLLRYVPDVVKGEFVNLGVVLLEDAPDGFTDVRFTRDWRRLRCLDPEADLELLQSLEAELRRLLQSRAAEIINYRGPMSRRDWLLALMQQSFSGALQLAPMQAVLTESPPAELGILARTYLESDRHPRRETAGRRLIFNAMRDAFDEAGVWNLMLKNIEVARYTRKGDPLKIDCGYRVGPSELTTDNRQLTTDIIHLFHALSLATDLDSAKVLAFSYSDLREGLSAAEHATPDLTAITEDGLNLNDEAVAFALATLQSREIQLATVSQMPAIAARARAELRL